MAEAKIHISEQYMPLPLEWCSDRSCSRERLENRLPVNQSQYARTQPGHPQMKVDRVSEGHMDERINIRRRWRFHRWSFWGYRHFRKRIVSKFISETSPPTSANHHVGWQRENPKKSSRAVSASFSGVSIRFWSRRRLFACMGWGIFTHSGLQRPNIRNIHKLTISGT